MPLPAPLTDSETASPSALLWSSGVVRVTGLVTSQVKVVRALYVPSAAKRATVYGPLAASPAATVPLTAPVEALMLSPPGRPTAP